MLFKNIIYSILFLFLCSCSWWGEKKTSETELVLSKAKIFGTSESCVNQTGKFFSEYFKGRSSSKEIKDMSSCLEGTINKLFEFAYSESSSQGFTRQRVRNALKSFDSNLSEEEVFQDADLLFLIKRMFIGGDKDGFTENEWDLLKSKLKDVTSIFINAKEAIEYIFFSKKENLLKRDGMYEILRKEFFKLDLLRKESGGELSNDEINRFIGYILSGRGIKKYKGSALIVKKIIFGTNELFFKNQHDIFKRLVVVFELIGRFRGVEFNRGFLVGDSVVDLIKNLKLIYENLLSWNSKNEQYEIPIERILSLISELHTVGVLNNLVKTLDPVNETLTVVLQKLFNGKALKRDAFLLLKVHSEAWIKAQADLIQRFHFSWAKEFKSILSDFRSPVGFSKSLVDDVYNFKTPVFIQSDLGVITNMYKKEALYPDEKYFDLSFKLALMSVAVPIMKAYRSDDRYSIEKISEIFINESELEELFLDFRPIGLEAGFADPYSCDPAPRVLLEANALTFSGNGDEEISVYEAAEWLGTMISVSTISNHVYSQIGDSCQYSGAESFGYKFQKRSCFKDRIFSRGSFFTDFLPGFSEYLSMLTSESRRKEFLDKVNDGWIDYSVDLDKTTKEGVQFNVLEALKSCKYEKFPLSRSEFNESVALMIYVENLFFKFDQTGIQKWHWQEDKKGADMILDGGEISNFLNKNLSSKVPLVTRTIKKQSWLSQRLLSTSWLEKKLLSLSDETFMVDRSKLLELIRNLLETYQGKFSQFKLNYCSSVKSSSLVTGEISFDKTQKMSCKADSHFYSKKSK